MSEQLSIRGAQTTMKFICFVTAGVAITVGVLTLVPSRANATDCQGLAGKSFHDARIVETDEVAPPFTVTGLGTPGGVSVKAPFCRVRGVIKPSADSDINFEVWLPPAATWNRKYQGVGNGGFAGSAIYPAMDWALQAGYAVSGTDTGHSGSGDQAGWALGHPEKVEDLGWRAIHETAVASKSIVEAYYGKSPAYSYFSGCSTGGRQGLEEAQRFPTDYNGIVVGAPAIYWPQLLASDLLTLQVASAKPENWVSPGKLDTVSKAAFAACHAANDVIDDPSQCHFDPSSLACKNGQTDACLTASEVATLHVIYSGLQDAAGKSIYPGFVPGSEAIWSRQKMGPSQDRVKEALTSAFPIGFFSNMVFANPNWDFRSISPIDALAQALKSKAGQAVYAENPDLSAFQAAGGKLIQYHSWNDPAIPGGASVKYYESVAANMGGVENIHSFYRLFMAPGMGHCSSGPGPNAVGGVFGLPSPIRDPEHDVISALATWVEDGTAPASITATLYRDNDSSKEVVAQRPWCAFPKVARYSGQGERNLATSYLCEAPRK